MTTRTKKLVSALIVAMAITGLVFAITPTIVSADAGSLIESGLETAAGDNYEDVSLSTYAGNVIGALLAATGIIFIVITVYAGVMYMTAAGDEAKVKKAKSMIVTSLIGIIIIVGAYAFTTFVVRELSDAASATQTQDE